MTTSSNTTATLYPTRVVFREYANFPNIRVNPRRSFIKQNIATREDSAFRAKRSVRDLIECNFSKGDWFITLTYAENMTNRQQAVDNFRTYIKKISLRLKDKSYLAVMEYQKRGAIHFHLLLKSEETVDNFSRWSHGFIFKKKLYGEKYASYVSKYVTKEAVRVSGSRHYFRSANLQKPQIFKGEEAQRLYSIVYALSSINIIIYQHLTKFFGCVTISIVTFFEGLWTGSQFTGLLAREKSYSP